MGGGKGAVRAGASTHECRREREGEMAGVGDADGGVDTRRSWSVQGNSRKWN